MRALTDKQRAILEYIEEFHRREAVPPTVYEIADHFRIRPASAFAHLQALQKKNYLERSSKARSIVLTKSKVSTRKSGRMLNVPIVGRIAAGMPLLATELVEENIMMDTAVLPWGVGNRKLFALRTKGLSMRDAGILDGDIIIVAQQNTANDGEIVVALVEDEATLKYLYRREHQIELRPANPDFDSQFYDSDQVIIQGVMVGLVRSN